MFILLLLIVLIYVTHNTAKLWISTDNNLSYEQMIKVKKSLYFRIVTIMLLGMFIVFLFIK